MKCIFGILCIISFLAENAEAASPYRLPNNPNVHDVSRFLQAFGQHKTEFQHYVEVPSETVEILQRLEKGNDQENMQFDLFSAHKGRDFRGLRRFFNEPTISKEQAEALKAKYQGMLLDLDEWRLILHLLKEVKTLKHLSKVEFEKRKQTELTTGTGLIGIEVFLGLWVKDLEKAAYGQDHKNLDNLKISRRSKKAIIDYLDQTTTLAQSIFFFINKNAQSFNSLRTFSVNPMPLGMLYMHPFLVDWLSFQAAIIGEINRISIDLKAHVGERDLEKFFSSEILDPYELKADFKHSLKYKYNNKTTQYHLQ